MASRASKMSRACRCDRAAVVHAIDRCRFTRLRVAARLPRPGRWLEKVGNLSRAVLTTGLSESSCVRRRPRSAGSRDPSTNAERAVAAALLIDRAGVRGFAERLSRSRREGNSVQEWSATRWRRRSCRIGCRPPRGSGWRSDMKARREVCRGILAELALE